MNSTEKAFMRENWDKIKVILAKPTDSDTFDVSSSAYVQFGTRGVAFFKWKRGKWYRKIVNCWRSLSFTDYMKSFNDTAWEQL